MNFNLFKKLNPIERKKFTKIAMNVQINHFLPRTTSSPPWGIENGIGRTMVSKWFYSSKTFFVQLFDEISTFWYNFYRQNQLMTDDLIVDWCSRQRKIYLRKGRKKITTTDWIYRRKRLSKITRLGRHNKCGRPGYKKSRDVLNWIILLVCPIINWQEICWREQTLM